MCRDPAALANKQELRSLVPSQCCWCLHQERRFVGVAINHAVIILLPRARSIHMLGDRMVPQDPCIALHR